MSHINVHLSFSMLCHDGVLSLKIEYSVLLEQGAQIALLPLCCNRDWLMPSPQRQSIIW